MSSLSSDEIIAVEDLWYRYPGSEDWALRGVDLRIKAGEFVCITGPSGCGKSTLLYCLNGIIPQAEGGTVKGRVIVDSLDAHDHSIYELAKTVGLVQQNPDNQMRTFTVKDELAFGPENLLVPKEEILERIAWAARIAKAEPLMDREIGELSGGQKQMVAIAAAVSLKPKVLVLDEPTSNIDPRGSVEIAANLKDIHARTSLTIVLAEHRLDLFLPIAERLIVMNEGRILHDGSSRSVLLKGSETLPKIGVRPPQVFELFMRLARCRCPVDPPLSPEEAVKALHGQLRRSFRCTCSPKRSPPPKGKVILEVKGLTYTYPSGFQALKGVDLEVRAGEFVGIIGNNGSGKTTFLLHMIGILKPQSGTVLVFGMDTRTIPTAVIARRVGTVFQYPSQQLFEDSVRREILFAPRNLGMDRDTVSRQFREVLKITDLEGFEERYPHSLSVGQMKRLNLASILVYDPDLIIMDEPFLGQDYGHAKKIMGLLKELSTAREKTIMIVSHQVNELTEYADRLLLFEDGRIIEDGPTGEVMGRTNEREGMQYFCTPICRLARLLTGERAESLPATVDDMITILESELE